MSESGNSYSGYFGRKNRRMTREGMVSDCPICGAELASRWDHKQDCPKYEGAGGDDDGQ